jgi:hypothetical protein
VSGWGENPRGYDVSCAECADPVLFHSLFYDVAERFADAHADARGHDTDIRERRPPEDRRVAGPTRPIRVQW